MQTFKSFEIQEDVLQLLGRNLVVVAAGNRSTPEKPWVYRDFPIPASFLLDELSIESTGPIHRLYSKRRNSVFTVAPNTNSKWILFVGEDPAFSKEHYLLSEGNPDIEICNWNTIIEASVEGRVVTLENKSTINGVPIKDSKFNVVKGAMAYIWGSDGELPGFDFIGNVDDGNTSVNWSTGSSRLDYLKIMFPEPGEIALPNILDIDDPITADGVDVVFEDIDPQEEYLVFQNLIGLKNVSEYYDVPKISIPMSKLFQP